MLYGLINICYDKPDNFRRLPWEAESVTDSVVSRSIRVGRCVVFVVDSSIVNIRIITNMSLGQGFYNYDIT